MRRQARCCPIDKPGPAPPSVVVTTDSQPTGDLRTALAHAAALLGAEPGLAEAQAREILGVFPDHPQAALLLASALRRQGRPA